MHVDATDSENARTSNRGLPLGDPVTAGYGARWRRRSEEAGATRDSGDTGKTDPSDSQLEGVQNGGKATGLAEPFVDGGVLLQLGDEDTGAIPMAGAEARCSGLAVSGRVTVAASSEGAERGRWRSASSGDAAISWRGGGAPAGSWSSGATGTGKVAPRRPCS
ncbi:hypothetical protein TRIUR3_11411 [Triticum urartu]|uniref:Uncharacterized protein n=1 Tax=Triticum urartu TaxID=4572 RepID=M8A0X8_TRIUA|nr:hypothetical protein TRIUR3_11411 [Triticum urartu]